MRDEGSSPGSAHPRSGAVLVLTALVVLSAAFVLVDQGFNRVVDARIPSVGSSALEATSYGLVSRLHLIVPLAALAIWRPHWLGLGLGQIRHHWRRLLLLAVLNCTVVGAYLMASGGTTPYSGDQWLLTEVVTVPVVEELMWRGAVFTAVLHAFGRHVPERRATTLTVWSTGIAFGVLHLANALVGAPLAFAVVQALNATVWGVVYGHARALTGSVYPPVVMHASMNLVVVLA